MSRILECRNFSFFYGAQQVLKDITFSLEEREILFIIGANGSGKSTLLKNFLRLVHGKSSGEILLAGKNIEHYTQKQLAKIMAYVPQADGLIPPFTVREFVNLSRYAFGIPSGLAEHDENVEQAFLLTNTSHIANKRMDHLSGGQRQRAFIAAAIAQNTPMLLMDEPTSFLDPKHVNAINNLLESLHSNRNLTFLIITHDLSLPFNMGGKVIVLSQERQIFFGPADELLHKGILETAFDHKFSYLKHPVTGKPLVIA